ncbi:MAG: sugar ABC transporter permease [Nonomuraea sp.]|nr:sugar ABC transporter permease [Nonomuraea sp.]NUP64553.1 sugar ABC transporter permease [Nonomuraea sp.]NUP82244.1 sugar ABC transporter permease [Nonomuraea sp.]NUS01809.1 sugar ABC transporter permease [Nonomuraea sp.]NUT40629.1 sugar ABC transporter permease [Thermoactinospora sp.]
MTSVSSPPRKAPPPPPATGGRSRLLALGGRRRREAAAGLLFAGPAIVIFAVFMFWPLVKVLWISFQKTSGFGISKWIGLRNYQDILADPVFWRALLNTALYTAISVPLCLVAGLAAALLLNPAMPGRGLLRAIFYLPAVISGVSSAIIATWMFNEDLGVVNKVLGLAGLGPVHWQSEGLPALLSLVSVSLWIGLGFNMVVYLAALQGIPRTVYEAARCDGAGRWQTLRSITFPSLGPTTFFLIVIGVINSFQVFDIVYVMTGGGPGNSTTMLVTYAYSTGFEQRQQGYASAIGVVLYLIVLVMTVLQWRINRRRDEA